MDSIKEIFRIGRGPSSSHTMGPKFAAERFLTMVENPAKFVVTLYGSLAATGKGHMTDVAILDILSPVAPVEIIWEPKVFLPYHPNGMKFEAFDDNNKKIKEFEIYSIGGGALASPEEDAKEKIEVYPLKTLAEIQAWCEAHGCAYWEYVEKYEGQEIWSYLEKVWEVMQAAIEKGLDTEGVLPGGLGLRRKASDYLIRAR